MIERQTTNFRESSTSLARVRLAKGKPVELDNPRSFKSPSITDGAIKNHVLVLASEYLTSSLLRTSS